MKRFLVGSFFFFSFFAFARDFFYPVGHWSADNATYLYFLHQKSLEKTELLVLIHKEESFHAAKVLSTIFSPVSVSLIPGGKGVSFFDVRIRYFLFGRRAPRAIDSEIPLKDISCILWTDEEKGFFTAQIVQSRRYGIFCISGEDIYPMRIEKERDYLFLQQSNTRFFCIERLVVGKNRFLYQIVWLPKAFSDGSKAHFILEKEHQIICRLQALDERNIFFVLYEGIENESYARFSYRQAVENKESGKWEERNLFTFYLPVKMLFGDERMCEIDPLMPKYFESVVYFVDTDVKGDKYNTNIFAYNFSNGEIEQKTFGVEKDYFGPYVVGKVLYVGVGE